MIDNRSDNESALKKALLLTAVYLAVEVIGGLVTHSLALLADAGHMLTDVSGLGLALIAIRFAKRPPTAERTYGLYRAEIIAAVLNSVLLLGISVFVVFEAYQRFQDPPAIQSGVMLWVAVAGLVVNAMSLRVLHKGANDSLNVKGAYFEVLSDFITSVGVIVGAGVMWRTGWYALDPLISAAIGLFIVPRTWMLLREAIGILLEGTPKDVDMPALRSVIEKLDGVVAVHDLHVWALTSGVNALSVHVVVQSDVEPGTMLTQVITSTREQFPIAHVTVQIEPPGWSCREVHV
jgi:cobalt-zinc-cadmium efflux system protein